MKTSTRLILAGSAGTVLGNIVYLVTRSGITIDYSTNTVSMSAWWWLLTISVLLMPTTFFMTRAIIAALPGVTVKTETEAAGHPYRAQVAEGDGNVQAGGSITNYSSVGTSRLVVDGFVIEAGDMKKVSMSVAGDVLTLKVNGQAFKISKDA